MSMIDCASDRALVTMQIELEVEELDEALTPFLAGVNQTHTNHSETIVGEVVELNAEQMEEVIAPYVTFNHNETIVGDEVELSAEELEEVIALIRIIGNNHNETIVGDEVE